VKLIEQRTEGLIQAKSVEQGKQRIRWGFKPQHETPGGGVHVTSRQQWSDGAQQAR
jgi:hypothetical protein